MAPKRKKSLPRTIFSKIKSLFLNGVFALFPIAVTVFVLRFLYRLASQWLEPLRDVEPLWLQQLPASEIAIVLLIIFSVGLLLKLLVIQPIIHRFERLISRIPFIKSIYSAAKSLVSFFNIPEPQAYSRRVVLIQYPRPQVYNLAFLLGPATHDFSRLLPQNAGTDAIEYVKVFMPNTPNPSSGYFFILPRTEIIDTNITFEEAIKTIVSCGLVVPESLISPSSHHDNR